MNVNNPANTETIAKAGHGPSQDEAARDQAKQLVEQCGGAEAAAQALAEVTRQEDSESPDDTAIGQPLAEIHNFATSLGFESFEALKHHSAPIPSNDGQEWFLTQLNDDGWCAWTEQQLDERRYGTRAEAIATVPQEKPLGGSALLG